VVIVTSWMPVERVADHAADEDEQRQEQDEGRAGLLPPSPCRLHRAVRYDRPMVTS
jgi:hypothetical protein